MHQIIADSSSVRRRTTAPTAIPLLSRWCGTRFVVCLLLPSSWMTSALPSSLFPATVPNHLAAFVPGIDGGSRIGRTGARKGRIPSGRGARSRPRLLDSPSVVGGDGGDGGEVRGGEGHPSLSSSLLSLLPSSPRSDLGEEKKLAQKDADVGANAGVAQSYHLVNSPGFPARVALYTAAIALVRLLFLWIANGRVDVTAMTSASAVTGASCHHVQSRDAGAGAGASLSVARMVANRVVLPLLSSACCAIQLLLNTILAASGCAGFNTYLGPLRPIFLAVLLNVTLTGGYRSGFLRSGRWIATTAASWTVALLPEIVHWRNSRVRDRYSNTRARAGHVGTAKGETVVSLVIPSMGCVACIQKVSSSLRSSSPHVVRADSWLVDDGDDPGGKGGRARVVVDLKGDGDDGPVPSVEDIGRELVDAVHGAGFTDCQVESFKDEAEGEGVQIGVNAVGGD